MVVASFGQCPRCHETLAKLKTLLKFFFVFEHEGRVILFRPSIDEVFY